ncbi:MAG: amylo-alpha-1,6-glucosidase [Gammaproteobacteria bacterium]
MSEPRQQYYIVATESPDVVRAHVLKRGETFAVFDDFGDIEGRPHGREGLYHAGTRYLSRLQLTLGSHRPLLLSSTVRRDNAVMTVDLTNPDLYTGGRHALARGTLHINRSRFLWEDCCYELIRIRNFSLATVAIDVALHFDADFADIFEVRGEVRSARGEQQLAQCTHDGLLLAYRGLDSLVRRTAITCQPPADHVENCQLHFDLILGSRAEKSILLTMACESDAARPAPTAYDKALTQATMTSPALTHLGQRLESSNPQFDAWVRSSSADLGMLLTPTDHGLYPYAGVPWFDTTFGRDGIWTALQTLWLWPDVSRGVLSFLAATQATETSAQRDSEPGKILHEARKGEMAALGEIPFGRYYGSVDATPLFVMLAGAYWRRTNDLEFVEQLWPHLTAALDWIDRFGDVDRDGFIEYARQSDTGLVHQGWKDSHDAIFHADGSLAVGPIALCEVQGYVHAARVAAAELAHALGHTAFAKELEAAADEIRALFEERFWCDDIATYAIALDGEKRRCAVVTSNPGHCLFTGIASAERARAVLAGFEREQMNSGWGLRTVAENEARYSPMAYHNGSVWPHDTAIAAAGAARYGAKALTAQLLENQFEAATYFSLYRLPELFCGFRRREGEAPTRYPVACSPQAWAAGSIFMLIEACLGMSIDARKRLVTVDHPLLPASIDELHLRDIGVGDASIDLTLKRQPGGGGVGVAIERRAGKLDVVVNR